MADDASYVIQTGAAARDRLELIARLFWPTTEAFLERSGALGVTSFVDVGCGIGDVASRLAARGVDAIGIDANDDVVGAATERSARLGFPATFRLGVLKDLGVDDGLCDLDAAYTRCVLSHQSDPRAGLASMVAAVRPGGLVLVEDVEVAAVWSSPANDALTRHVELYVTAALGLGASPGVGSELATMLRDLGATDVDVELVQPLLRDPSDLQAHARTMEAIAVPVIEQGLATEAEVDELVAQLDEFATTPGVVATLPRIIQVSARTAGG